MTEEILYVKCCAERRPAYRQNTMIIRRGQEMIARKIPQGPEAAAHVKGYAQNAALLRAALQPGANIRIAPCTEHPDGSVDFQFYQEPTVAEKLRGLKPEDYVLALKQLLQGLKQAFGVKPFHREAGFEGMFGKVSLSEESEALKISNLDLNFDNLFCAADGGWILIDYEWIVPYAVPLTYSLYRALMLDETFRGYDQKDQRQVLESLGIDETLEKQYHEMEFAFLNGISLEEDRLDYYIRVPGAQKVFETSFDEMSRFQDTNHELHLQLNQQLSMYDEYAGTLWFRGFRKLQRIRKARQQAT